MTFTTLMTNGRTAPSRETLTDQQPAAANASSHAAASTASTGSSDPLASRMAAQGFHPDVLKSTQSPPASGAHSPATPRELPPDEVAYRATHGEQGLRVYQEIKARNADLAEAHKTYEATGKIPQTRTPFSWIEIKEGRLMSRAERYDAMLKAQGKTYPSGDDLAADRRNPEYLTREEFHAEFYSRIPVKSSTTAASSATASGSDKAGPIHAEVRRTKEGLQFDFSRPITQKQAAQVIFKGGKVPEGAKLAQGPGNTWVVQFANDADALTKTMRQFNAHTETFIYGRPGNASTYTWGGPAPSKDLGFKIQRHYRVDEGQAPERLVRVGHGEGHGYEVVFNSPMTHDQVMSKLFDENKFGNNEIQLVPVPREPTTTWQVYMFGVDAAVAYNFGIGPAFSAALSLQETFPPELPAGMRDHFENKTLPVGAVKHGDAYVWEQEGYLAYVKTDGKGGYQWDFTKLATNDEVSNKTIRHFVLTEGLPPRQAWQKFVKHWDELHRDMILALMGFYSSAATAVTILQAQRRSMPLPTSDLARQTRNTINAVERDAINTAERAAEGEAASAAPKPVPANPAPVRGHPLDDTHPLPGNVRQPQPAPPARTPASTASNGNRGGPLDDTAPQPVQTVDTSSPRAPAQTAGRSPKEGEILIGRPIALPQPPADNVRVRIVTASGPREMTAGEYRNLHRQAEEWVTEQMSRYNPPNHLSDGAAKGARLKHLIEVEQLAAEKFGLDRSWKSVGNPIIVGRI